tara:strand:- start:308 stop:511 length:204 start_codon:yes stop_codon:yes gene_type:complete
MTELILESIADNANFTPLQMRKIKNLKWARDNAQDLPYLIVDGKVVSFKKMWSEKLSELICNYLKLN